MKFLRTDVTGGSEQNWFLPVWVCPKLSTSQPEIRRIKIINLSLITVCFP